MSNYSRIVDYAAKDALTTGNPTKALKGTELGSEFDAIATMSATKEDTANKNAASGYTGNNAANQSQALGFVPTGSAVPVNGLYLPGANTIGWATNTTARGSVNSTGNYSLLPASSGITFQIPAAATGGSTTPAISVTASAASLAMLSLAGNATTIGTSDFQIYQDGTSQAFLVNRANLPMLFYTNTTLRATINAAGGLTVAAPTSGIGLITTGVASNYAFEAIGNAGAGVSFGALIKAGNTSADINMLGQNSAGTEIWRIQGDGVFKLQSAGYTPSNVITFANPPTITFANSNVFTLAMTGNISSAAWTLTGPLDGQSFIIFIKQDATGSRTIVWPTTFWFPGGASPALSTAANSKDMLVATYSSTHAGYFCTLSNGFA